MSSDRQESVRPAGMTGSRGGGDSSDPGTGAPAVRGSRWAHLRSTQPMVAIGLLGLWMLLSGKMSFFHLGSGVVLVAVIMWQSASLEALEPAGRPRIRFFKLFPYGAWLFWQMITSAIDVARVIVAPSRHLDPRMVEFRCRQPSLLNGVLLSGSITLTPGTVAIDLDGDRYVVHALTPRGASEVLEGDMARRVFALSSDEPMPPIELIELINASDDAGKGAA